MQPAAGIEERRGTDRQSAKGSPTQANPEVVSRGTPTPTGVPPGPHSEFFSKAATTYPGHRKNQAALDLRLKSTPKLLTEVALQTHPLEPPASP